MTKEEEELLEIAKRNYPIGTRFYPAHLSGRSVIYEIVDHETSYEFPKYIGFVNSKEIAGGRWAPNVYDSYTKKWAEIVSRPEPEKWEPKVGDWIYILKPHDSKYSTGDVVKITRILSNGDHLYTDTGGADIVCKVNARPALPHEIPQEEVEYVECIHNKGTGFDFFNVGTIYKVDKIEEDMVHVCGYKVFFGLKICKDTDINKYTGFKPSTLQAYEEQQNRSYTDYKAVECIKNTSQYNRVFKVGHRYVPSQKGGTWFVYENQQYSFEGSTLAFKKVSNEIVNNVSQINQSKNEKTKCNTKITIQDLISCGEDYSFPTGKRRTGAKIQLEGCVLPSKSRPIRG